MNIDMLTALVVAIGGAGGFAGITALYKAISDRRLGVRDKSDQASERHIKRLEGRIESLESKIGRMEQLRERDQDYISILLTHVATGLGPPPPKRP